MPLYASCAVLRQKDSRWIISSTSKEVLCPKESLLRNLNGKMHWDFRKERNNVERYQFFTSVKSLISYVVRLIFVFMSNSSTTSRSLFPVPLSHKCLFHLKLYLLLELYKLFLLKHCQYHALLQSLSVPRCEQFSESKAQGYRELRGTHNIQGQIYEHTFRRNGGYFVRYPSISFDNVRLKCLRVSYCLW